MTRTSAVDRRRQLADAAVAILIEEGPQGLTTRAVARRAGAPLGTVHYAFASKDDLLAAAADQILGSLAAALNERVDPTLGVRAAIGAMLSGYWAWSRSTPGLSTAVLETVVAGLRTPHAGRSVAAAELVILAILQSAAQHDARSPRTPVGELARLTLVVADGLTLAHAADALSPRADTDLDHLTTMLQALV